MFFLIKNILKSNQYHTLKHLINDKLRIKWLYDLLICLPDLMFSVKQMIMDSNLYGRKFMILFP
jgi:hypothetical protein